MVWMRAKLVSVICETRSDNVIFTPTDAVERSHFPITMIILFSVGALLTKCMQGAFALTQGARLLAIAARPAISTDPTVLINRDRFYL